MSQSSNPPDSQALLQSMLERLKLQPGRERHACEHTGEKLPHASTLGTDGVGTVLNLKKEEVDLTNGYVFSLPGKRFGVSSVDTSLTSKYGEGLQPVHDLEQYRGHFFFPPQRDRSQMDGDTVLENVTLPPMSNASTGQQFLAKTFPSFGKTDTGEQQDNISGYKDQDNNGFQNNVHDWSWGSTDFAAGSQRNKSFHTENGGFGDLSKSKNMQMIPHKGISSMTKRKQRSSENQARRWTQKLKERWMERAGKKGKDEPKEGGMNKTSAQSHFLNTSHQDAKLTLPSLDSCENATEQSEDDTIDAFIRSSDNFQFGFSSVSLLEEIVSGQEWAKFLSPSCSGSPINQETQEKKLSSLSVTPNRNGPSTFRVYQSGGVNREWSFRGRESFPIYNVPISVNLPEVPTQNNTVYSDADQSEPMEQGQIQSHVQLKERALVQPRISHVERADILDDSPPTTRVNRKRQHHTAEMSQMDWSQEGQGVSEELRNSHMMDNADEQNKTPFSSPNGSSTLSVPSNLFPCCPVPKGVLRHSTYQNADLSRESKRRRVEPNRRVHFAETVQEIPPVLVDQDIWDSEEEHGTELGSELEDEKEKPCMTAEEEKEVSARRPGLPAWIRALKRKNTGRKH
ncbi:uncharacterized protein zgc:113229 [Syngnathoides biaculeatus]|uniref:uncharacterized protein zgc:113229 n=1 Tax=Syngnathoides biaculeatus TaxID=300417 RepID=UPI002ADE329B|nr:uncharacterized protein zgc:113229 [Syngnathoides biaculeatus]